MTTHDHTCIYCGIECDCESAQDECFGCSRCINERNAIAAQSEEFPCASCNGNSCALGCGTGDKAE